MTRETATLIVHRGGGWADRIRAYRIFVNDVEVGRIKRNSSLELTVPAGLHMVGAKIDWTRAEPVLVDPCAGEIVEIDVFNTHGAFGSFEAIGIGRHSYLTLSVRGRPARSRQR
ncbi:hypothetical protein V8J82_10255 [Gymnodinialimonas sp. 2305UL16-5]|uniref:hypothetical protein n=1 Tax=Gymnodinialimonas mytili TaxID=3126503 RepID=UPI0030986A80